MVKQRKPSTRRPARPGNRRPPVQDAVSPAALAAATAPRDVLIEPPTDAPVAVQTPVPDHDAAAGPAQVDVLPVVASVLPETAEHTDHPVEAIADPVPVAALDRPAGSPPVPEAVLSVEPAAETPMPVPPAPPRPTLTPARVDVAGIGATLLAFAREEGAAALAHLRALGAARSPAEAIRLQVAEIERAADASLTCWSTVARQAGRLVAFR